MPEPDHSDKLTPQNGIDTLLADDDRLADLRRRCIGLLTNEACRTATDASTVTALAAAIGTGPEGGLCCLFAPEHGAAARSDAGQAIADNRDAATGLPVTSLYGARLAPAQDHLDSIDILLVDLRDVGVRCYTYAATAALAAQAALQAGKRVIICDRPNPLGNRRDGPLPTPELRSLVAWFDVPFLHGQTLGQLVQGAMASGEVDRLTVIPAGTGDLAAAQWVPPSPGLRSANAVRLYPGLVLFENSAVSEGRGTPTPFECIGAPWLDAEGFAAAASSWPTGVAAEPTELAPAGGLYSGQRIAGVHFTPQQPDCDALALGVFAAAWIAHRHPEFGWQDTTLGALTPDGNRRTVPAIDAVMGSPGLREALAAGTDPGMILAGWQAQIS